MRRASVSPKTPFIVTKRDIERNFYGTDLKRGLEYFNEGRVLSLNIETVDDQKFIVHSTVFGKLKHQYQQEITVEINPEGRVEIEGICTCPVEFDCKHSVAVCFTLAGMEPGGSDAGENPWLDKLVEMTARKLVDTDERNIQPEYILHYRLLCKNKKGIEDIRLYRSKLLKSGTYSRGARIDPEDIINYHLSTRYDYLSEEDRVIVALLDTIRKSRWSDTLEISGKRGYEIVRKMVDTGRAFYCDSKTPLSFDDKEKFEAVFRWKSTDDERYILQHDLDTDLLFKCDPPLLIDHQEEKVRIVDTSLDGELFQHLLNAPAIPRKQMITFIAKSLERLPEIPIPLPEDIVETLDITDDPVPKITIDLSSDGDFGLYLSFVYGDMEIPYSISAGEKIVTHDDRIYRILRDGEFEKSAVERLAMAGLKPHGEKCRFVSEEDRHGAIEIYRLFLEEHLPALREDGWLVSEDREKRWRFSRSETLGVNSTRGGAKGWFELSFEVEIDGEYISIVPLVASLLHEYGSPDNLPETLNLEIEPYHYLHIESRTVEPILRTIYELLDNISHDKISVDPRDAHLLGDFEERGIVWKGEKELVELSRRLKNFSGIETIEPSPSLQATLREYQLFGLSWLHFLHRFGFGGILADDMGLGKTIQVLSFVQKLKSMDSLHKPILVVLPTSLLGNWKDEIEKFTPDLTYLTLYGLDRERLYENISRYDMVLTSYQTAQRDREKLSDFEFSYIVLDEAQKIKNPRAKITRAIKSFQADHRLAMTGTPMENHLGELWSIFDFLMPGFLGTQSHFKELFQNPIEKNGDSEASSKLRRKIAPFVLRRTKDEVLDELPEKIEMVQKIPMGEKQSALYENVRVMMEEKVMSEISRQGIAKSHMMILDALLRLRQICCDPALLKISEASKVEESAKREYFFEMVEEMIEEKRKILVFSQFTSMLSILEKGLKERGIAYSKLTGSTRKRDEAIEKFRDPDCRVFLISLKAGGVGLNLVEADTVIHYDPWWNPAVENQATDRAYRIGQTRTVFVYRLIIENSIEEKILHLQKKKSGLQNDLYTKNASGDKSVDAEDLIRLLRES
jgi:superfamily II DNA or RNA helicase